MPGETHFTQLRCHKGGWEAYKTALLSYFDSLLLWMSTGHLLEMNCEFSMLKIKSQSNPFHLKSIIWESWHIIHHIKPTQGVYPEIKGFQDLPMYSWEKYHVTIQWNFWTHCMKKEGFLLAWFRDLGGVERQSPPHRHLFTNLDQWACNRKSISMPSRLCQILGDQRYPLFMLGAMQDISRKI